MSAAESTEKNMESLKMAHLPQTGSSNKSNESDSGSGASSSPSAEYKPAGRRHAIVAPLVAPEFAENRARKVLFERVFEVFVYGTLLFAAGLSIFSLIRGMNRPSIYSTSVSATLSS